MSMTLPQQRSDIAKLIPHEGSMCLLEKVLHCTETNIRCETGTHRDHANPLRNQTGLPVTAALEYAAQAAAVQGGLHSVPGRGAPRGGYLAVLSNITWTVDWLDNIDSDLVIEVFRETESDSGVECRFTITGLGRALVEGTFVVAFAP